MGRDSGFVALHASLANCDTNICLIPEVRAIATGSRNPINLSI
jgi:6-phosphofructokinase